MSRDPSYVTYADLINESERRLNWMKKSYPGMIITGQIAEFTAKRRIAIEEQLLRLLKRHKKDLQLNLNDLFDKMK